MTFHADPPTRIDHPTVVLGGGLAGLAAAVSLSQHGVPVTLIESRPRRGDRAAGAGDASDAQALDHCPHVLLRACTHLLDLYERLGVDEPVRWHRELHFAYRDAAGRPAVDTLASDDLPGPMHLLRPLWQLKGLTRREKFAIARGMLAILQVSRRGRDLYADQSFATFLAEHGQPGSAIEKFWAPVVVSACNQTLDQVAANDAIRVFQEGFLYGGEVCEVGLPTVPLEALYEPAQRIITAAGGKVLSSTSAEAILFDGQQVKAVRLADGQEIAGRSFISAVPFDELAKLASPEIKQSDARLAALDEIEVGPILGAHLFVKPAQGEGPVMDLPHLLLREGPASWVLNKGMVERGEQAGAQHLHAVIHAAHGLADQSDDEVLSRVMDACRKLLPGFGEAALVQGRVVKERRATFSLESGVDDKRPTTTGAIRNLLLAGDWVDTGWPTTMEGAVRSGDAAASAVLDAAGAGATQPVEDLEPGLLYQALAG